MFPRLSDVTKARTSAWAGAIFNRYVTTAFAAIATFISLPVWVQLVATFDRYGTAYTTGFSLFVCAAIATLMWPSLTPPWRTLVWSWLASADTGSLLLLAGAGHWALTGATIAGAYVAAGRANHNGRRALSLVQDWRTLR